MEENKNNTHKWLKIFILVFIIIVIFLFNKDKQNRVLDLINSFKSEEKTLLLTNSFDNDNILDINIYNDTMAIWKENKLSFIKTDGEMILEKEFSFTNPAIYYGEKYIYPFDKDTGDIYFLNKSGETVDRLQLGKEIFNIKEIKGHLFCHSKDDNKENIDILDKDWVLIGNPAFEDKSILSYDINKNGSRTVVSLLNLNDNILKSEIQYYGENNEELGSLNIEGEIILFNEIIKDADEVILTDKSLYYVKDKEIVWKKEFNLIKDIYIEEEIYILHGNYLEIIDLNGETISKVGFTKDYNNIANFRNSTMVYGDENLAIVSREELVLEHDESILKAYNNGGEIIILGPNVLNIYKLTNKE